MYNWRLNILSNDAKRMFANVVEDFIPYPGLALRGYIADHEVKVSAVVYDKASKLFRISLAWMSAEPADSNQLTQLGWQKLVVQQQPAQAQY